MSTPKQIVFCSRLNSSGCGCRRRRNLSGS